MSKAVIPEESYELARCGAGFGEVTLNPLHAALIAAAIGNQGVMMRPYLIETVQTLEGEVLYQAQSKAWTQPDWRWVKGHAGHDGNERADELANLGVPS